LASGSEDATIKLWDLDTGQNERNLKGHTGKIQKICFNSKGDLLASCANDNDIKIWNMSKFTCI